MGQIYLVRLHIKINVASLTFISGYGWGLAKFRGVIFPCIQLASQRLSTLFCLEGQLHLHSIFLQSVNWEFVKRPRFDPGGEQQA